MRMTLCAILAFLVIGCSPSNEKKAQKLIAAELKQSLNDYSSYESVSYGTLDSVYSSVLEDEAFISIQTNLNNYKTKSNEALAEADVYSVLSGSYYKNKYEAALKLSDIYLDSIKQLVPRIDSLKKAFVPQHLGWRMSHKFRSNNALGAKVLGEYLYFFDKELTKITDSKQL